MIEMGMFDKLFGKKGTQMKGQEGKSINKNLSEKSALIEKMKKIRDMTNNNAEKAKDIMNKVSKGKKLSKYELEQIQWTYLKDGYTYPWAVLHDSLKEMLKRGGVTESDYEKYGRFEDIGINLSGLFDKIDREGGLSEREIEGFMIGVAIFKLEVGKSLEAELSPYKDFAKANLKIRSFLYNEEFSYNYDILKLGIEWDFFKRVLYWESDINRYLEEKIESEKTKNGNI